MESKHRKPLPVPSVTGLILAIAQTINTLRAEEVKRMRCYACDQVRQKEEFQVVNKKFESLASDKFAFMVESLGLSGANVPPEFFTDNSINICWNCFRQVEKEYENFK